MNSVAFLLFGGFVAFAAAVKQTEPGCPYAPEGTLATVSVSGSGYTKIAEYRCLENTIKVGGSEILECEGGKWLREESVLKCRRLKVCPPAPEGWNVMVKETGNYHHRTAMYECTEGYKAVGGEHTNTCYDGKWETLNVLVCYIKRMPMCDEPPKSDYTLTRMEKRGEVDYAFYECEEGSIEIDGVKEIYCTKEGRWSSLSVLRCQKLRECPEPPAGVYSYYEVTGQRWQQEAVYKCEEGYITIGGESKSTCYDGKWLEWNVRRCRKRPECPEPPAGVYSTYTVVGAAWARVATYTCDDETVYIGGVRKLTCEHGRYDSYDILRCRHLRECPPPPVGLNVKVVLSGKAYDRTATYTCAENTKYVSGESESKCYDGIWLEHNVRLCRKLRVCPPAPEGYNSKREVTAISLYSTTATYTCVAAAFKITGSDSLSCYDGIWTGFIGLRCRSIDVCPEAPAGRNSMVSVTGSGGAQWASYTCDKGLVPITGKAKLDCDKGRWLSYDALYCKSLH